ncbi:MAG: peroxiredoxin [Dehalococcoidia bacterium]|nr:peroxiredoxin [Dehalococcoidia bacterium]
MPQIGKKAPDFALHTTRGSVRLADYVGKKLVLVFYTEDGTPGCTQQLAAFRDEFAAIQGAGADVLAVSADSLDSHRNFHARLGAYPFPLASDADLAVTRRYDVLSPDGKRSVRAVFVIDQDGAILHAIPWYQPGNTGQFLQVFQALGAA